ncbi:uncharacterized protein RHIMIDRAFT_254049 [Rhizopus microsporus ATCC 52813]|uniref:Uncharacterized protein n=1 Tax=Rhizopus microsporus ATCC 52813 TaxID=1340429 RepID=A0A2G4T8Z5_RHIZD|nr:uncharacterized protein RHIMIDRAFT_254049 [Rhizopus microsporus ATCC 52813]PHZ17478.1 hypothetical protein RHIMIDRAFT_254049 [Rhizopus microsporus ATCC 52813]
MPREVVKVYSQLCLDITWTHSSDINYWVMQSFYLELGENETRVYPAPFSNLRQIRAD